ncbi:hypothetical protein FPQ18DRAFT_379050 [Pyronema domesticum]|nr:hypothetical protein FPQ18DRAFT_379050 [Pyronema domesticum]
MPTTARKPTIMFGETSSAREQSPNSKNTLINREPKDLSQSDMRSSKSTPRRRMMQRNATDPFTSPVKDATFLHRIQHMLVTALKDHDKKWKNKFQQQTQQLTKLQESINAIEKGGSLRPSNPYENPYGRSTYMSNVYMDTRRCNHASQPTASTTVTLHTPSYASNMDLDMNAGWGDPTEEAPSIASQHVPKATPHPAYNTHAKRYRTPQPTAQPNGGKTNTTPGFNQNEPNNPIKNAKPQYTGIIKNNLTNVKQPSQPQKPYWQKARDISAKTKHQVKKQ